MLELRGLVPMTGMVEDASGQPIAGVRVLAYRHGAARVPPDCPKPDHRLRRSRTARRHATVPAVSSEPDKPDLTSLVARAITALETVGPDAVAKLCAEHPEHAEQLLARLHGLGAHGLLEPPTEPDHPQQIGRYRVQKPIGEGGMGVVYLAEQQEPVQRRVALKLIKLGMDSRAVVKRFELERQALAMMDHEGIARVFDCGTSDRGMPYFVMELVQGGVPIDQYCDRERLSLEDRILLMCRVCAAVQHAHQKGVVHRDLKPGNVLVSDNDGQVQIKVIDFGLAKAMGEKLIEATLYTEIGQIIGTPEYMAPEQANPTNLDIDTRADIYSLGVMLYEILVGELPFSGVELRQGGMFEAQRILREVDPPRPSTKITEIGDVSISVARARRTSVGVLRRALRNDLDWVVLKALEKDRQRRYDTANALAEDLRRFLDHEPLAAGPPSAGYRLRKLMRRYRGQVFAVGAVVLASILGVIAFAFENARARRSELEAGQRADENERLAAAEMSARRRLQSTVAEFRQLSGVVRHERAIELETTLHPAWPSEIEAMRRWLEDECDPLLAMRPDIRSTIERLRMEALPWDAAEQQQDLQSHPRYDEWRTLGQQVNSLRYAQEVRAGQRELIVPELDEAMDGLDAYALSLEAWKRIGTVPAGRTVYGEEALGLALAQAAAARGPVTGVAAVRYLDMLAWALLANGQSEAARAQAERALAQVDDAGHADYTRRIEQIEDLARNADQLLTDTRSRYETLTATVHERRTWSFPADKEPERFLHATLVDLLDKLRRLENEQRARVRQRLVWAESIEESTRTHPNARVSWDSVLSILESGSRYASCKIELHIEDMVGLVPLGPNPATGLLEFYHLRSAWDGTTDPRALEIPAHDPETGYIEPRADAGIVFVLLPGGTTRVGAQPANDELAHFDRLARKNEWPVAELELAPYLIARHELTKGQWNRLWSGAESFRRPSSYKVGFQATKASEKVDDRHPVEQVDWSECRTLLAQHGLLLPTEAQWEHACRASSTSPWSCELDELVTHANVGDRAAARTTRWKTCEGWEDGFVIHAPVGSFAPNSFGLFDMHGNVWEWCRDLYGSHESAHAAGDGLRLRGDGSGSRVYRGGAFSVPAARARSSHRHGSKPTIRMDTLGLRAARSLTPSISEH